MRVLITGGTGFIGSHTAIQLIEAGHDVSAVDNLSNSSSDVIGRIHEVTGAEVPFFEADVGDRTAMGPIIAKVRPEAVIHCAALKAVGESVEQPLRYYENNVGGTARLLQVLDQHDVRVFVFSSSCTVYGDPDHLPVTEESPTRAATNPYGWTKLMMEQVLTDLAIADSRWSMVLLRYFNPVGAHPSGLVGENPRGIPSNLMPYVAKVAAGELPYVRVYGNDYPTPDGTGVRDFIHVVDVADGHVVALERLGSIQGRHVYNLGTGRGHSVLEVIAAFAVATGIEVPYRIEGRRAGDVAASWAGVEKARDELGWMATMSLDQMCADAWRWELQSQQG